MVLCSLLVIRFNEVICSGDFTPLWYQNAHISEADLESGDFALFFFPLVP